MQMDNVIYMYVHVLTQREFVYSYSHTDKQFIYKIIHILCLALSKNGRDIRRKATVSEGGKKSPCCVDVLCNQEEN